MVHLKTETPKARGRKVGDEARSGRNLFKIPRITGSHERRVVIQSKTHTALTATPRLLGLGSMDERKTPSKSSQRTGCKGLSPRQVSPMARWELTRSALVHTLI